MKRILIILLVFGLIMPVSALDPVTEVIDGINQIMSDINNLGIYIWNIAADVADVGLLIWENAKIPVLTLLYPIILTLNLLYGDFSIIYEPSAMIVNFLLGIPDFALLTIQNFAPISDSPYTSDAIESLVGSYIYTMWINHRHIESTSYALLSVAMMIFSITAMAFLRIARFLVWLYKKIPVVGGH